MKQDFILQYFKDLPNGLNNQLPNENTIDDNMYKDIQHNDHILDVNKEENLLLHLSMTDFSKIINKTLTIYKMECSRKC